MSLHDIARNPNTYDPWDYPANGTIINHHDYPMCQCGRNPSLERCAQAPHMDRAWHIEYARSQQELENTENDDENTPDFRCRDCAGTTFNCTDDENWVRSVNADTDSRIMWAGDVEYSSDQNNTRWWCCDQCGTEVTTEQADILNRYRMD